MRIHPDHHHRHHWHLLPLPGGKTVAGTPNSRDHIGASRSSYEPRHGEAPARWHVVRKPSPARGLAGGSKEPARRDLSTLRPRLTAIPARPATPTNNWADIARGAGAELSPSVAKQQDPRQAVLVTRAVLGYVQ